MKTSHERKTVVAVHLCLGAWAWFGLGVLLLVGVLKLERGGWAGELGPWLPWPCLAAGVVFALLFAKHLERDDDLPGALMTALPCPVLWPFTALAYRLLPAHDPAAPEPAPEPAEGPPGLLDELLGG